MIVWLASYPRSGNTLVRIILRQYFGVDTYSIYNDEEIASNKAFSEVSGHKEIKEDIPTTIHKWRGFKKYYFVKTHEVRVPNERDLAIHIVRDGRDAILSYKNYKNNFAKSEYSFIDLLFEDDFIGDWGSHYDSWKSNKEKNLLLKYEDVVNDIEGTVKKLAKFLNLRPLKDKKIPAFQELQRIDKKFFGKGQSEAWKKNLSEEENNLFELLFDRQIKELGYPLAHDKGKLSGNDKIAESLRAVYFNGLEKNKNLQKNLGEIRSENIHYNKELHGKNAELAAKEKIIQELAITNKSILSSKEELIANLNGIIESQSQKLVQVSDASDKQVDHFHKTLQSQIDQINNLSDTIASQPSEEQLSLLFKHNLQETNEKVEAFGQAVQQQADWIGSLSEMISDQLGEEQLSSLLEQNLQKTNEKVEAFGQVVQQQADRITNLKETINSQLNHNNISALLENNLEVTKERLNDFSETIQAQFAEISSLNETVRSQLNTIIELEQLNLFQEEKLKEYSENVETQTGEIAHLKTTINKQQKELKGYTQTINEQSEKIKDLNETIRQQSIEIVDLGYTTKEQSFKILDFSQILQERIEIMETLQATVDQRKKEVLDLTAELSKRTASIEQLTERVSEKEEEVLDLTAELSKRTASIEQLTERVSEKEEEVKIQTTSLYQKEQVIQELVTANNALLKEKSDILNSRSWQIVSKLNVIPYFAKVRLKGIGDSISRPVQKKLNGNGGSKEATITSNGVEVLEENGRIDRKFSIPVVEPFDRPHIKKKQGLAALAIPCVLKEQDDIIANFKLWDKDALSPYKKPLKKNQKIPIVLIINSAYEESFEEHIKKAFWDTRNLCKQFSSIEFFYCNLSGDDDVYEPDYTKKVGEKGYKSGPNNQFFMAMQHLSNYGDYAFYLETDCYPVKTNWLGALHQLVDDLPHFWILGSIFRGISDVDEKFKNHLNGNAIYGVGDPQFQLFLTDVLHPFLIDTIRKEFPWLAYDCAIEYYFYKAVSYKDKLKWNQLQEIFHLFLATEYIQNHSGFLEARDGAGISLQDILRDKENTYIVHGRHLRNEVVTQVLSISDA